MSQVNILTHGKVVVEADEVTISGFTFDCNAVEDEDGAAIYEGTTIAILWAIDQLNMRLEKNKRERSSFRTIDIRPRPR